MSVLGLIARVECGCDTNALNISTGPNWTVVLDFQLYIRNTYVTHVFSSFYVYCDTLE